VAGRAKVNVTLALPVEAALQEKIRAVDGRLNVTPLTRAQRNAYREGRTIWAGYAEPAGPGDESEEQARRTLDRVLQETEVILTNPVIPADIVSRAPKLRWLQLTSAGADRLLDAPVMRSHVKITTASGVHAVPISEYVLGAMIAFAKGFPRSIRAQAQHAWRPFWPEELEGKTAGVIGVGAIGAPVAALCKALGMRVLAVRRSAKRRQSADGGSMDEVLPPQDLPYLLGESDYVVVSVPLTPETRHMIAEPQLRAMKPSAVLINIARGAIVDTEALTRALKEGWIAGAALDVFEEEPLPPESPLWDMENVLLTPHISGGTPRYMERAVELFCDNLRRYLAGAPLRNVVDPARGY
jgi:D-2-hydroxyacid dehydrogenase (NADP+)